MNVISFLNTKAKKYISYFTKGWFFVEEVNKLIVKFTVVLGSFAVFEIKIIAYDLKCNKSRISLIEITAAIYYNFIFN